MADFSRRESQILDILFAKSEATAVEIRQAMTDAPSDATVRTILKVLEDKQAVTRRKDGKRFIYRPRKQKATAGKSAMRRVLKVFYEDSLKQALTAHLMDPKTELDPQTIDSLRKLIDDAEDRQHKSTKKVGRKRGNRKKDGGKQ